MVVLKALCKAQANREWFHRMQTHTLSEWLRNLNIRYLIFIQSSHIYLAEQEEKKDSCTRNDKRNARSQRHTHANRWIESKCKFHFSWLTIPEHPTRTTWIQYHMNKVESVFRFSNLPTHSCRFYCTMLSVPHIHTRAYWHSLILARTHTHTYTHIHARIHNTSTQTIGSFFRSFACSFVLSFIHSISAVSHFVLCSYVPLAEGFLPQLHIKDASVFVLNDDSRTENTIKCTYCLVDCIVSCIRLKHWGKSFTEYVR